MNENAVRERTDPAEGQLVMPFYLLCDVSASMSRDIHALNDGVRRLRRAIVVEPVVDDVVQICLMTFSDTAEIIMPLGQMSEREVPMLRPGGGTNYGAAFRELARAIGQDRASLSVQGYKIYRPCAFFLTDGMPNDRDWHRTFTNTLTYDRRTGTGMKSHPIFVPFGFRAAQEEVLAQLAYPPGRAKWYHSKDTTIEQSLNGVLEIIMLTVINSGRTAGAGQPTITPPPPPLRSGIVQGDSAYDSDYV